MAHIIGSVASDRASRACGRRGRGRLHRRSLAAALVLGLGLTVLACKPQPLPGSVDVVGDSLTVQATNPYGLGDDAPDDVKVIAGLGWQAPNVQSRLVAEVVRGRPETLVVALGTNDSNPHRGGWTSTDTANFRTLLATPHPDTCIVIVLPAYGPGIAGLLRIEMQQARASLRTLAGQRPRTVVADWLPVIQARPELVAPDGVHLRNLDSGVVDPVAAATRTALYWLGVANCPPR